MRGRHGGAAHLFVALLQPAGGHAFPGSVYINIRTPVAEGRDAVPSVKGADGDRLGVAGGIIPAAFAVVAGGSDDGDPGPVGLDHHIVKGFASGLHTEAHINNIDLVLYAPVDAQHNIGHIGRAVMVKGFDRIQQRPWRYTHHATGAAGRCQRSGDMGTVAIIIEREHPAVQQVHTGGQ
ncbi:hypothetical protein D3C73_689450 [compost metagenome]